MAANMLGLEVVTRKTYKGYGSERGHDAEFVVRMTAETKTKTNSSEPHEIGMVPDSANPGCYVPHYDPFAGGFGMSGIVGNPTNNGVLCPVLKQHYDMCCDALAAKAAGDTIEFLTLKDAGIKYPSLFKPSEDEKTWCSIVNTDNRVEETLSAF